MPPSSPRPRGGQLGNNNAIKHGFYTGGALFAPPSRHQETKSPLPGPSRTRGGQHGNNNATKHGFYTRRLRKRDVSGVEDINMKSLADEIALIRVLTRRLVESCGPEADLYDLAGTLRAVCLASATITRVIRSHALLSSKQAEYSTAIDNAIDQIAIELGIVDPPPSYPRQSDPPEPAPDPQE